MLNRIAFSAAAVAALSTIVIADATSDFKKAYMADLPKVAAAFKNKNASFFDKMSTADFTYVSKDMGTQNKQQAMAGLKSMFATVKSVDYKCTPTKFQAKGNTFVVSVAEHMSAEMLPMGADKKKHTMSGDDWCDQTFAKVNGKWLMKKIEETKKTKALMDGKPFDPSKMMPPPSARPKSSKG